jgi:two-component system cell cycle response regulator DivK
MKAQILIIEDNERNMYMETYLLEFHGYKIFQARNGFEGIELAQKEKPDLILLDIQLPKMDGYTVAKELKKNKDTAAIPIVAVTSYAMAGDREKVMKAGCKGYLEKPINPDTFVADVVQFI